MDDNKNVGGRDRLVRLLLTVVLSIAAVRWLRSGKRLRGLLAGVGALGFGFNATTGYCGVNDALDIDTTTDGEVDVDFDDDATASTDTDEDAEVVADESESADADDETGVEAAGHYLSCAVCSDPIVPGQSRGPNSEGDIVHDDCE